MHGRLDLFLPLLPLLNSMLFIVLMLAAFALYERRGHRGEPLIKRGHSTQLELKFLLQLVTPSRDEELVEETRSMRV